MGSLLGEVLPLAVAVAVSPFPIVPAVLLLFSARPRSTSGGFLAGWVVGIAAACGLFALLASTVDDRGEPGAWTFWLRIGVGAVLVVAGARQWLGRRREAAAPVWMSSLEEATPRRAARRGILLSAANPKIVVLAAAAGLAIGSAGLPATDTVVAVVVFTLVSASTVAVPLVLYLLLGDRMLVPLGRVKDWLQENSSAVMAVVLLVIGGVLVVRGVSGL